MSERLDRASLRHFAVIVLAAGASRRFGSNKLVHLLEGRRLVEHVLDTFEHVGLGRRLIVTGGVYQGDLTHVLDARPNWEICVNDRAAEGMGTSIAAGATRLGEAAGAFICPADMPRIRPEDILSTVRLFAGPTSICRPTFRGQPGHPVLWGRAHFERLRHLEGEQGGAVILRNSPFLLTYNSSNMGVVVDLDEPDIDPVP